jgi:cytochrome c biogenesis protein CcmG, thiol:disulfide interchange protein DsbE
VTEVTTEKTSDRESTPKRSVWRKVAIFVPAVAFIGLLAYGVLTAAPPKVEPGDEIPDFELQLLDGSGTISKQDLMGSPVVINFFASWCFPCREEAPLLREAAKRYAKDGVQFIGVDIRDARSRAELFVDEFDLDFPILRDEDLQLADQLGVFGIPETFFIDHEGKFVGSVTGARQTEDRGTVVLGAIDEDQLNENVEVLIRRAAND